MYMVAQRIFRYKGVKTNSLGIPSFLVDDKSRTKKENRKRNFYYASFVSNFPKDASKNLLVVYDIPEAMKKERDWFRRQLKNFDFIMIQRSVWVGPSPLPREFLDYVKEIKIGDNFKTFKLAKSYTK